MKKIQIQLMDDNLQLLSAPNAKKTLNSLGFRYIKCAGHHCVSVKTKDLPEIQKLNGFHLLDDDSTEMGIFDIHKIFILEDIRCE